MRWGAAFLVSVLLFPERLEKKLVENLSAQKGEAAHLCRELTQVFVYGEKPVPKKALGGFVGRVHANKQSLSGISHHELLFSRRHREETLQSQIDRMERIAAHLQVMAHALHSDSLLKQEFYMKEELLALGEACAHALEEGPKESTRKRVDEALEGAHQALAKLRSEGATHRFDLEVLAGFYGFWDAIISLTRECGAGQKES